MRDFVQCRAGTIDPRPHDNNATYPGRAQKAPPVLEARHSHARDFLDIAGADPRDKTEMLPRNLITSLCNII